jgi:hypothetical protein
MEEELAAKLTQGNGYCVMESLTVVLLCKWGQIIPVL